MGTAFAAAIRTLGIASHEPKHEAVAKFIIGLARENGDLDAATLHRKAVAAFSDPVVAVLIITLDTAKRWAGEMRTGWGRTSVSSALLAQPLCQLTVSLR
jgi:hypothetical protein